MSTKVQDIPTAAARPAATPTRPRFTLARRFLLANAAILLVGGLVVGVWVGDQLERGILDRTAAVTALYVDSFVEPHLQALATGEWLQPADTAALDDLVRASPLSEKIVSLRIWSTDGTILYSPVRELVGQTFGVDGDLAEAIGGQVTADLSDLQGAENVVERQRWSRLMEMYVPVRERGTDRVIAVAEFYQLPDAIDQEVGQARLASWAVVAAAIAVMFLLLFWIVKGGSDTITRQERALQKQVGELSTLLAQNEALSDRVRTAAARSTTLNERSLRRISSDLHDGPGQMLSLALLRLDGLRHRGGGAEPLPDEQVVEIEGALQDALRDMRVIAAGLRLPELVSLSPAEVATRAVDDHRRRSGTAVALRLGDLPTVAPLPVKIALFRALQELLSNATRYGGGQDVRVTVDESDDALRLEVRDAGPGFDRSRVDEEIAQRTASDAAEKGGLGLAGIKEQAEVLGGGFDIDSGAGQGTAVHVWWPLGTAALAPSLAPGSALPPGSLHTNGDGNGR